MLYVLPRKYEVELYSPLRFGRKGRPYNGRLPRRVELQMTVMKRKTVAIVSAVAMFSYLLKDEHSARFVLLCDWLTWDEHIKLLSEEGENALARFYRMYL